MGIRGRARVAAPLALGHFYVEADAVEARVLDLVQTVGEERLELLDLARVRVRLRVRVRVRGQGQG